MNNKAKIEFSITSEQISICCLYRLEWSFNDNERHNYKGFRVMSDINNNEYRYDFLYWFDKHGKKTYEFLVNDIKTIEYLADKEIPSWDSVYRTVADMANSNK